MIHKTENPDRQAEKNEAAAWADPYKVEKHLGIGPADEYALNALKEDRINDRRASNPVRTIEDLFGTGSPEQNKLDGDQRLGRLSLQAAEVVQIPVEQAPSIAEPIDVQIVA